MKLISAVCRFPAGEVRTSAQGREYISALFRDDSGAEHRVFGGPDFEPLKRLQAGQRVQLAEDSRGRLHLVEPDAEGGQSPMGFHAQPQQPQAAYQVAAAPVPVADPADPVINMADAWGKAFARLLAQGVPPEQAGPGASTILIQLGRR